MRRRRLGWLAAWVCGWTLAWLVALPVARAAPAGVMTAVEAASPRALTAGEVLTVAVTVHNRGRLPLDPELRDRIAYHWTTPDGEPVIYDGVRTPLPHALGPGESVTIAARLEAPPQPGDYALVWQVVREEVAWLPSAGEPVAVAVAEAGAAVPSEPGEPAPSTIAIEVRPDTTLAMAAGETITWPVTVTNVGAWTLADARGDRLSYHWYDTDGRLAVYEGRRTELGTLAPGESRRIDMTIEAPPQPGPHRLAFAVVREHVTWADARGADAALEIDVGRPRLSWSLMPFAPPNALAAGDSLTVELTVRNEGTEAWRGDEADRLSYRWLDDAGRAIAHEGLRSPLPTVVEPGESIAALLRVLVPNTPGTYRLAPTPVREHVRWLPSPVRGPGSNPSEAWPQVVVTAPRFSWRVVGMQPPAVSWVGHRAAVPITIENTGAETWSPARGDRLSYRWRDPQGDELVVPALRTELPHDVAPGERVSVDVAVVGPSVPGRFELEVAMVREHVQWFGAPDDGASPRAWLLSSRAATGLSVAFVFMTIALVAARSLHAGPAQGGRAWIADRIGLPLWTAVALGLVGELFAELSGLPLAEGARATAWSCASIGGLFVSTLPARAQAWVAAGLVGLAGLLCLADLAYLEFFGTIVPVVAVSAAHHLGDAVRTVTSLLSPEHGWLFVPFGAALVLLPGLRGRAPTRPGRRRALLTRLGVVVTLALASTPALLRGREVLGTSVGRRVFSQRDNVVRFGVFGAHGLTLARVLREAIFGRPPLTATQRAEVESFFEARRGARHEGTAHSGAARDFSLVVVQAEALSSWVVDLEVDGEPVMPFLASAAADAWLARDVFDQTAQGRTSDAEYLVLASGHPLAEGALSFLRAESSFSTLAHALSGAGYTTHSAHPYARGFWNRALLHPRYGFATSDFRRELGPGPTVGWGLSDGAFLERMATRLAQRTAPRFAFLITLSLHHPYARFPAALAELSLGDLDGTAVGNYLQAMRHLDGALQAFAQALPDRERTVLVVYGDHVTGLEDEPSVGTLLGVDPRHPAAPTLLRRVPLIVWAPGLSPVATGEPAPRGQIDIGPTLADLLGVTAPPAAVGQSLADPTSRVTVLPNGSALATDRFFVARGPGIGAGGACFDASPRTWRRVGLAGVASRPREDCAALADEASRELARSRAVLDHDLHRELGPSSEAASR